MNYCKDSRAKTSKKVGTVMSERGDRLDVVIKQVFERMKKLSPKPESCPDDHLLAAYHEGGLIQEEMERIEGHLVLCDRCTENLILLSEVESPHEPVKGSFATEEMIKRAKDLVRQPVKQSLKERIGEWLSSFRPFPVMATASAVLLLLIFSVYSLYTPSDRNGMKPGLISFAIIASVPSGGVTRGTTPGYKESELREGGVLRSGDRFRIKFELQKGAYVCLLALNSQGNLNKILHGKARSFVFKAEPNVPYFVPQDDGWFQLDNNKGVERIYLLSSADPIGDIDHKIDELKKSGIDNIGKIFSGLKIQSFTFRHE